MKDKLWHFLIEKVSPATAKRYYNCIKLFIETLEEREARRATYQNVMDYLSELRNEKYMAETIKCHIVAIKKYYQYLAERGIRNDNPAKNIVIKDKRKEIQLQDLFTAEELETLMDRKERYPFLELRNKVMISLMIYQALSAESLAKLTLKDIKLDTGEVYVKGSGNSLARTLQLKPKQVALFQKYLSEGRPRLVGRKKLNAFLITKIGTPITRDDPHYIISTFQYLFPERKLNPMTIRQSVIHNLLKAGHDLRVVQVFAGHKNISSTEAYRQKGIEELQHEINKYHPLG